MAQLKAGEKGLVLALSISDYVDSDEQSSNVFNTRLNELIAMNQEIWSKSMHYKMIDLNQEYISKSGLIDTIKQSRFEYLDVIKENYSVLVVVIIARGNSQELFTSDGGSIEWNKIYDLFSFSKNFFVPTLFCIDVFNQPFYQCNAALSSNAITDKTKNAIKKEYEQCGHLNVFGYDSINLDYFGFVTHCLYEYRKAINLRNMANHILIWSDFIWTVPENIDYDHEEEYKQADDHKNDDDQEEETSIFDENEKSITQTVSNEAESIFVTVSITRQSWGPFLCKYEYNAFVNNAKDERIICDALDLKITAIGNDTNEIIVNEAKASEISETHREESGNSVHAVSVTISVKALRTEFTSEPIQLS